MDRPLFRIFGIPVTVQPWFLLGLVLFYAISGGGRVGAFTAVGVGVFVLIHELGHAVVARRFGAEVSISLNFLIGWASYSGSRTLTRTQRNLISLMGPFTQLTVAVLAMEGLRLGLHPVTQAQASLYADLFDAVAWSGVTLAVLNLLPLWPLDGGHVVASFFGRRSLGAFLGWSVAASVVMFGYGLTIGGQTTNPMVDWADHLRYDARYDPLLTGVGKLVITVPAIALTSAYFIALFCGMSSWQALQALRFARVGQVSGPVPDARALAADDTVRAVRTAERQGWETGRPGEFPRGWVPSPWLDAHLAAVSGADAPTVSRLLERLAAPGRNWVVDRMDRPEIGRLVALLPPSASACPAAVEARVFHGPADEFVSSALAAFHGTDSSEAFYVIAEGFTVRQNPDEAMTWLAAAVERAPDARRLATSVLLRPLHKRSDFQQLLGVAERASPR